MARTAVTVRSALDGTGNSASRCTGNGAWRCAGNGAWRIHMPTARKDRLTISAMWEGTGIAPAGKVILSVDGEPGTNNLMDLSEDRVGMCNGRPAFVDVDVQDLPKGGAFVLYFR